MSSLIFQRPGKSCTITSCRHCEHCEHFQINTPGTPTLLVSTRMAENRVVSKNLFNFRLEGLVDDDILEREKEWVEQMGDESMEEMNSKMDAMPDEEFAVMLQGMMESEMTFEMTKAEVITEVVDDNLIVIVKCGPIF